jgi:hypothetical protein
MGGVCRYSDLVVYPVFGDGTMRRFWQASFREGGVEQEIELSSPTATAEKAVQALIDQARFLTLLGCRSGDDPRTVDEFLDTVRSKLNGLINRLVATAPVEHQPGSGPPDARDSQGAG